jgi:Protein of unknown function (DUF3253)
MKPPGASTTPTPAEEVDQLTEAAIEEKIFDLLSARREGATICPSEVARALQADGDRWRALMPRVRQVAHGLAQDKRLAVTRGGLEVDATSRGGPIRLGRPAMRNAT